MNGIRVLILCAAFAIIGFLGGRWTGSAEAKKEAVVESGSGNPSSSSRPPATAAKMPSKSANRHPLRPARPSSGNTTVDLAQEIIDSWNQQTTPLADGSETELLIFDLAKFGRLMGSLERAGDEEIARLRGVLLPEDEDSFEAENLKTTALMVVAGRDIQLHGSDALDRAVTRMLADPDEDVALGTLIPAMLYSLAVQDRAAAEKWLEDFARRPDTDELFVDLDELKAALEKSESAP